MTESTPPPPQVSDPRPEVNPLNGAYYAWKAGMPPAIWAERYAAKLLELCDAREDAMEKAHGLVNRLSAFAKMSLDLSRGLQEAEEELARVWPRGERVPHLSVRERVSRLQAASTFRRAVESARIGHRMVAGAIMHAEGEPRLPALAAAELAAGQDAETVRKVAELLPEPDRAEVILAITLRIEAQQRAAAESPAAEGPQK